jgi:nicotinamide-nucleotide amidase
MRDPPVFPSAHRQLATRLLDLCRARGLRLATAESCTGGLVSGCLTAIPGSSDVFDLGFVTYSNAAKTAVLGVLPDLLSRFGAVSEPVAVAMAEGALAAAAADLSIAVTGISGPGGGSAERPVGLVHFATARRGEGARPHREVFAGDREAVRLAAVGRALELLTRRVA